MPPKRQDRVETFTFNSCFLDPPGFRYFLQKLRYIVGEPASEYVTLALQLQLINKKSSELNDFRIRYGLSRRRREHRIAYSSDVRTRSLLLRLFGHSLGGSSR